MRSGNLVVFAVPFKALFLLPMLQIQLSRCMPHLDCFAKSLRDERMDAFSIRTQFRNDAALSKLTVEGGVHSLVVLGLHFLQARTLAKKNEFRRSCSWPYRGRLEGRCNSIRLQLKQRTAQRDEQIEGRCADKAEFDLKYAELEKKYNELVAKTDSGSKHCSTPVVEASETLKHLLEELNEQKLYVASEHFDENKWLGTQISELMELKTKTVSLQQENEDLKKTLKYTQEELSAADGEIRALKSELNSKPTEEEKESVWSNIPASVVSSPSQIGSMSRSSFGTVESTQLEQIQTDFNDFKDFMKVCKEGMQTVRNEISELSKKVDSVSVGQTLSEVVAVVADEEKIEYDPETAQPVAPSAPEDANSAWQTKTSRKKKSEKSEKWGD